MGKHTLRGVLLIGVELALNLSASTPLAAIDPPIQFEDASALVNYEHVGLAFGGDGLAGAAWIDYDNDGFLDLFLTNGRTQSNGLFRNDGHGGFLDVASVAGVQNRRGNSGVVVADFDNDGFRDLFLTGDGGVTGSGASPVVLYRNNGDGTFSDITAASGIAGPPTANSAAAADIDNDGFLDLFIGAPGSLSAHVQHANRLFRNNGDLTFTDISAAAGVNTSIGAFAALFSDYDHDGFIDLFVGNGNDVHLLATPNELFRNNGHLAFNDVAPQAGLAAAGFWMGLCGADYDNDDDIDVFVTNFGANVGQPHALYRNNGDGTYSDVGAVAGVANFPFAWGCAFKDFDDDGDPDLFFAGALPGIDTNPGTLLFNNGDGTFTDFTASSPVDLRGEYASGVASGDYDNDGFEDIVVMRDGCPDELSGQPVLLHNRGNHNRWVTIRLVGTHSNRDAVGAQVRVTAGSRTQVQEVYAGSSFASTDSSWVTFGIGSNQSVDRVQIRWPLGTEEVFRNVPAGRIVTLVEGTADARAGDCNLNGSVMVDELVRGIGIALGEIRLDQCWPYDSDGDGRITIDDVVRAVRQALA